jgi:hypothetical protein
MQKFDMRLTEFQEKQSCAWKYLRVEHTHVPLKVQTADFEANAGMLHE